MTSPEGGAAEAETTEAPEPGAPVDERRAELVERYRAELGDALVGSHIRADDDLWLRVRTEAWRTAGEVAKHTFGCTYFDFLSVIDWLPSPFGRDMDSQEDLVVHGAEPKEPPPMVTGYAGGDTRLQVFARVVSLEDQMGVTLKADLPDGAPSVDSWVPVHAGANWHEREAWEMFGVDFVGHPHLVHMYLPGDFEGHPLRKDFPLLARRVKPWPGIVDVEPMPGEDEPAEGADGDGTDQGGDA